MKLLPCRGAGVAFVSTGIPKPILAQPTAKTIELVATVGREVEPHEGAHQILYPTGESRVGVKDLATLVSCKDSDAHHVFAALDRRAVVGDGAAGCDILLLERHSENPADVQAIRDGRLPKDGKLAALSALARTMIEKRGRLDNDDVDRFVAAGFGKDHALGVLPSSPHPRLQTIPKIFTKTPLEEMFEANAWSG